MQGHSEHLPGSAVSPEDKALLEMLAERLDLAVGRTRLELDFRDGRLIDAWKKMRIPPEVAGA